MNELEAAERRLDEFWDAYGKCRYCRHARPLLFGFFCDHPESFPRDVTGDSCCECWQLRDIKKRAEWNQLMESYADAMGEIEP